MPDRQRVHGIIEPLRAERDRRVHLLWIELPCIVHLEEARRECLARRLHLRDLVEERSEGRDEPLVCRGARA